MAVQYLWRLVNAFYKDNSKKSTATSSLINSVLPMTWLTVKPISKKQDMPTKASGANKNAKKTQTFDFYLVFGSISIAGKKTSQSHDLLPFRSIIF